ncbi:hypothetical protein GQ600_25284 [Phytophthora cactorum]|nr:hypothetical protein GQ600_25284 [Phytophthora cactorum]
MTGYSELKQAMREQLVVNAGVMIREHCRKRLRAYVLIKFGKTGDDLTSEEEKASKKLVGQIMYACYNVEETDMLEALQMRDNGMEFYIRLIWEFQSVVEDRMEAVPNEKGLHIVINGTTLAGFVSRIRDRGQGNLMEDWNMPQVKISTASFKVMRWTVMRRAFGIDRFETRKEDHLFAKKSSLTGTAHQFFTTDQSMKNWSSDSILECARCVQQLGNILRLQAPRRRSRRKKTQFPKVDTRAKRARHRNNRDIVSVTTREYRHLAGFNRFRAWNESQKRNSGLQEHLELRKYLKRLDYFWQHAAFLLRFCLERPYLKWRFFRKRMARVAVDEIARRIVPTVSRLTCVAYGDWSRRDGIKGHAPSPVKGLKEALQKRATVVSMDEFRTSKLCSQCHQSLSSVQYPTPVFPKGVQKPKRRKMKGKGLPRDWSRAEIKSKHCHVVLRCENVDCEARYWD